MSLDLKYFNCLELIYKFAFDLSFAVVINLIAIHRSTFGDLLKKTMLVRDHAQSMFNHQWSHLLSPQSANTFNCNHCFDLTNDLLFLLRTYSPRDCHSDRAACGSFPNHHQYIITHSTGWQFSRSQTERNSTFPLPKYITRPSHHSLPQL